MAAGEDALEILRSIDATLKALLALSKQRTARTDAPAVTVASDRDLDGKYGDPLVKFNPRDWSGMSFVGRHFSECDPIFLDLLAGAYDYFAEQAERKDERTAAGKPVSEYKRLDAARARGWAKRIRPGGDTGAVKQAGWASEDKDGWQ